MHLNLYWLQFTLFNNNLKYILKAVPVYRGGFFIFMA
jgi:hypothetical protein